MLRLWQIVVAGSIAVLALSACEPKVAERGKVDIAAALEQIHPQETTQTDVIGLLGTPSAVGQFGDKAWYYMSQRKEGVAFMAPEVVDSEVLRITFDADQKVATIKSYNQADMHNVDFTDRKTPTAGQEYGFFEQLIGNIGKFNKQRDTMGP